MMKRRRKSSFFGVNCEDSMKQLTITESFKYSKKVKATIKKKSNNIAVSVVMVNKESASLPSCIENPINSPTVQDISYCCAQGAVNLTPSTVFDKSFFTNADTKVDSGTRESATRKRDCNNTLIGGTKQSVSRKLSFESSRKPAQKLKKKQGVCLEHDTEKVCEPQVIAQENILRGFDVVTSKKSTDQPSCSTSLNSSGVTTTPSKCGSKSPAKNNSPTKNSPQKVFKSKEGKQLQIKHVDLLVDLIEDVCGRLHFKSYLNEEAALLGTFLKMNFKQKYVVMKLFVWKKMWYNVFEFCKKAHIEMGDDHDILHNIFKYLSQEGIVDTNYKESTQVPELLNSLNRQSVKDIAKQVVRKNGNNKEEDIGIILRHCSTQQTFGLSSKDIVLKYIEKKMGFCIKLTHNMYQALSHAYILATFSNSELENIQDYFRNQLHLRVVFPDYDMEDYVVFISREEFLSYCEAKELQKSLDECIAARNKTGISAIGHKALEQLKKVKSVSESVSLANQQFLEDAPHLKMFTAVYVYSSVLSTCVEHLFTEKNGDPKLVKGWLDYLTREFPRSRKIGKWFYRLIQIHIKHLKPPNYEEAANILIDVLSNKTEELSDVDKHELGKLGKALKSTKAYKLERIYCDQLTEVIPSEIDLSNIYQRTFDAQCKRTNQLGKKRKYVAQHGDDNIVMAVEDYALACYRDEYPGGMHCEGSLLRSLLVLFFWDIIYKPKNHIPGVFITKIQTAPLDMFTKYFLKNRMAAIKKRLHEIQSVWSQEELVKFAQENYKSHAHEKSVFGLVNHVIENADMVDVLLKVIDRRLLACIFLRILSDLRQFRSGMPDLFLWNVNEGKCKFVEVKGEGDKLSTTQELWLQYLKEKGADVEICYIHSKGSKRRKLNRQRDCTKKEQKEKGNVIEAEVNNLASHC